MAERDSDERWALVEQGLSAGFSGRVAAENLDVLRADYKAMQRVCEAAARVCEPLHSPPDGCPRHCSVCDTRRKLAAEIRALPLRAALKEVDNG